MRFARAVPTLKAPQLPARPVLAEPDPLTLAETAPGGSFVGQTVGTIETVSGSPTRFAVASGNSKQRFGIPATDGALRITARLDYETAPSMSLGILGENAGGISAPVTQAVTVTDIFEPVPWVPTGTWAYYEVADASNVIAGETLTQLTDLTGNGRHWVQHSTYPPPGYVENGIGGYPTADFAQEEYMALDGNAAVRGALNGTSYFGVLLMLAQSLGTVERGIIAFSTNASAASNRVVLTRIPSGPVGGLNTAIRRQDTGGVNTRRSTLLAIPSTQAPTFVFFGVNFATRAITFRVGGTTETYTATAWTAGTASATDVLAATLGYNPIGDDHAGSQIAAMALYRTEPSTATLDAEYLFMQQKYNAA